MKILLVVVSVPVLDVICGACLIQLVAVRIGIMGMKHRAHDDNIISIVHDYPDWESSFVASPPEISFVLSPLPETW